MNLNQWAIKHGVPFEAVEDLRRSFGVIDTDPVPVDGVSEAAVQTNVRLEASRAGCRLFRNNVGAWIDDNGVPTRYGLANESKQMNKLLKSHDLIGIRPVLIQPYHVGTVIGQFLSREIKPEAWRYTGTPREMAQLKWAELIVSLGGDACFTNGTGSI